MADSAPLESLDPAKSEIDYQAVEPWAIAGLILGLLSPLALISPVLWLVPILGLASAGVALVRIRRDGRPGRAPALVGLALSTFFIVVPMTRNLSAQLLLAQQARPVADQFFEYLRQGDPERALLLEYTPDFRARLGDEPSLYFRSNDEGKLDLRKFASYPVIRMILALGEKAQVRYCKTTGVGFQGQRAHVEYLYAVTFIGDDGQKKTYFVGLRMERMPTPDPQFNPWQVREFAGATGAVASKRR